MKRIARWAGVACLTTGLWVAPVLADKPAAPEPVVVFAGDGLEMRVLAYSEDGSFTGELVLGENAFPMKGKQNADETRAEGTFQVGDDAFSFVAETVGDGVVLKSGGATYTMKLVEPAKAEAPNPLAKADTKPNPLGGSKPAAGNDNEPMFTEDSEDGSGTTITVGPNGVTVTGGEGQWEPQSFGVGVVPTHDGMGWQVLEVDKESTAESAGMVVGDVIIDAFDGQGQGIDLRPERGFDVFSKTVTSQSFALIVLNPKHEKPLRRIQVVRTPSGAEMINVQEVQQQQQSQSPTRPQQANTQPQQQPAQRNTTPPAHQQASNSHSLQLKQTKVYDPGTNNMHSHNVLVPEGWNLSGSVTWTPMVQFAFVHLDIAITAPDGREVRSFPNGSFTYGEGNTMQYVPQPGELSNGKVWMPPAQDASQFITQMVIPSYRPNATNIQLVSQDINREAQQQVDQMMQPFIQQAQQTNAQIAQMGGGSESHPQASAPIIRVRYTENGQSFEEEFNFLYFTTWTAVQGYGVQFQGCDWLVERMWSMRAPAGQLNNQKPFLTTIAMSVKPTREWFAMITELNKQLAQIRQRGNQIRMEQVRQTSAQIAKNNSDILDINHKAWQDKQASDDRLQRSFTNSISGVDDYTMPDGTTRSLDSSYNKVYTNGVGDILYTDDLLNNPNIGSTQTWTEVKPITPMGGAANY